MTNGQVIEIRELTKVYGNTKVSVSALCGVDLDVQHGQFVAIMGPSGSGKSTLMNILGCLDRPTGGTYVLNGEDVSKLDKNRLAAVRNREIGFVFQSYNLLADEPTGNLDTHASEEILGLLHDLNDRGMTILMVTHESDIAHHAGRIIQLRDGLIVADHANDGHQSGDPTIWARSEGKP